MIEYKADCTGTGNATPTFSGSPEALALEAAVLISYIYDFIKAESEEDAELFRSNLNILVNNPGDPLYEVVNDGD